jgi:spore coat polysaccharide biosynthesis protein SpsF
MSTGIFLQVRIGSTRLKRKALLPLVGGTIIEHTMRALKKIDAEVHALLTDESSTPELTGYAQAEDFEIFTGPEEDVLARYALAARYFGTDVIIRATGDSPLVSAILGEAILKIHKAKQADLSHYIGPPLGTGVEVVSAHSLFAADKEARDHFEREHMTTYIYRHPDRFKVIEEPCSSRYRLSQINVSIDEKHDYETVLNIYHDLYSGRPIEIDELVSWLKRRVTAGEVN